MKKYHVIFDPVGRAIDVVSGTSLLDAARLAGIGISSECGGYGYCGKCRVIVIEGEVASYNSIEKEIFTQHEIEKGFRLACCTSVQGNTRVQVPESSLTSDMRLQLDGDMGGAKLNPGISAYDIQIDSSTPNDNCSGTERVKHALAQQHNLKELLVDASIQGHIEAFIKQHGHRSAVFIRSNDIVGIAPHGSVPAGLAIDLGTTKIAAYLLDLTTGKALSSAGIVNPQISYGGDVMTRLRHVLRTSKQAESHVPDLTRIIRGALNDLVETLIKKTGISYYQITRVCIVGNPPMTHLLLNLPVKQLASPPYTGSTNSSFLIKAGELGLKTAPGALAYIPPAAGGFVGSDHIAMITASDIDRSEKVTLGIDIGTNTEIVLRKPGMELTALSCPSGPAFEGAHISEGVRASKGAIETVKLNQGGAVEYRTIGNALPIGLCGSAMIDTVAELYKWQIINERGRMQKSDSRIRQGRGGLEFLLVRGSENISNKDLVITQEDIDEILLAKGAIRAGIEILLEVTGISLESVEEVIIAGAFGSFINLKNAVSIGMFPGMPNALYRQVGNAAMAGAEKILLSLDEQKRSENAAAKTAYIELATNPGFNRKFAEGIMLPKQDNSEVQFLSADK